jgi:hypothetical protein
LPDTTDCNRHNPPKWKPTKLLKNEIRWRLVASLNDQRAPRW